MEIKAKVWKSDKTWLKGMASITIDDSFVIKDIKIIDGKSGLFVSMPNRKNANGEYQDICFPITAEARKQISDAILNEYNNLKQQEQPEQLDDSDLPF